MPDRESNMAAQEAAADASQQAVDHLLPVGWRALLDDAPLAIAYLSADLRLLRVNGGLAVLCERMGADLVGRHCYEALGEEAGQAGGRAQPCSPCGTRRCLETGLVQRFERSVGQRVLKAVASPVRDRAQHTVGALLMLADVTAERELQRELIEAQELAALGLKVAGIAHDIQNPLMSIGGSAQLLHWCRDLPEEAREHIERICRETRRCQDMVGGLLNFTRRKSTPAGPVDLNLAVKEALDLLRNPLAANGIRVHEQYHPAKVWTIGRHYELQQVVHNIVDNALDAMREARRGSDLVVRTHLQNGQAIAEFENNGPALKEPEKVFLPLYTTKEADKGTGLGLYISRTIVEQHSGTIRALNTPRGVVFRVELPSAPPP